MHGSPISQVFVKRLMYWGSWEMKCTEKGVKSVTLRLYIAAKYGDSSLLKENHSLESILSTHGLSYANPRHWYVLYALCLLHFTPTLVKEAKRI